MNSSAIWLQIPGEGVPFNLKLRRELPPLQMLGKPSCLRSGRGLLGLRGGECGQERHSPPCHSTSVFLEGAVGGGSCRPLEDSLGSAGWGLDPGGVMWVSLFLCLKLGAY